MSVYGSFSRERERDEWVSYTSYDLYIDGKQVETHWVDNDYEYSEEFDPRRDMYNVMENVPIEKYRGNIEIRVVLWYYEYNQRTEHQTDERIWGEGIWVINCENNGEIVSENVD